MATPIDGLTGFLISPPGQLTAGSLLCGIVWKFSERIENVLTDQTKGEIAKWLRGVKTSDRVRPWAYTFATMFDRVFGEKHFTWRCFWLSGFISLTIASLAWLLAFSAFRSISDDRSGVGFAVRNTLLGCSFRRPSAEMNRCARLDPAA
jgi:hypothetical protein